MNKKNTNEIIYCFIDSQNIKMGIKELGWDIDYKKLSIYLKDKFKVSKLFFFIGYIESNKSFYEELDSFGYDVIFKPTIIQDGKIKGNCDAELVLHTMIEYNNYDKAIIISGDGDFHCLIEYLEQRNKLLIIGIPNSKKYSSFLKRFKKYHFYFNYLNKKLGVSKKELIFLKLNKRNIKDGRLRN